VFLRVQVPEMGRSRCDPPFQSKVALDSSQEGKGKKSSLMASEALR
jgi:hypothetical protein